MEKLEKFIDTNYNEFITFEDSEVAEYSFDTFDNDVIEYLKNCFRNRFDYRNICVYYSEDWNCIAVEHMA